MRRAIGLAGIVALLAGLAAATPASAAVGCTFSGSAGSPPGLVVVALDAAGDSATLAVQGGEITLNGARCESLGLLGEPATTRNTDEIAVGDSSGGGTEVRISDPAAFAPGRAAEGDGSAEIEFDLDLGDGDGDVLRIEAAGPDVADRYELGALAGAPAGNLNARTEDRDAEDADIRIAGVERIAGDGRALDDKIDGDAGAPFDGPIPVALEAFGADGEDTLRGGSAADLLYGGAGDDLLEGGLGRDVLLGEGEEDVLAGGEGPDRLDGGDDDDIADYRVLPDGERRGLVADLDRAAVGGAGKGDRLFSVEGVLGTGLPDAITGNGALNFIEGGAGADELSGLAERDALFGSMGADSLLGGGARDVLFGGPGRDRISGELGKDIVSAGPAPDRIETQKGVDVVDVAGGGRDVADCGPGRDGYDADRRDRLRSCEVELDLSA
ncbi:MAG TPA: calcium-binding protein [Solirubrobacterales bacterium]